MSLEEIDRVNRKFEEATSAGDAEGLSQLYSKDAIALPPDAAMVRGREAIAGLWRHVFDEMGLKKIELGCTGICGTAAPSRARIVRRNRYATGSNESREKSNNRYVFS